MRRRNAQVAAILHKAIHVQSMASRFATWQYRAAAGISHELLGRLVGVVRLVRSVLRKRSAWPSFACAVLAIALALGTSSSGQQLSNKVFARYGRPLKSVTLDMDSGTITRGPRVTNRTGTTVRDFDNNDLSQFVGVDTGAGFCRWIDAAVKGTGVGQTAGVNNNSDLMNNIIFAYCSAQLTPGSGGPGGAIALEFYEGYTLFGGAPTTEVAAFTLAGLPGNSASSSFFGGFTCYFLHVVFSQLLAFADGPIGYSAVFLDSGTGTINPLGAVLAGTWPFLGCVVSCSGAIQQVDEQGMTDMIDEYCPPSVLRSSFSFGTTSGSFTSISMAIGEVADVTATLTSLPGIPAAPDALIATPAVTGASWTATVTSGFARAKAGSWTLFFGNAGVALPTGFDIGQFPKSGGNFGTGKAGRRLLSNFNPARPSGCANIPLPAGLGSSSACAATIPRNIGLVCSAVSAQAIVIGTVPSGVSGGGNTRLTNAIFGTVGTTYSTTGAPPVAQFVGSPLAGIRPLTVNFTNQSTGTIDSHAWSFGDGETSSAISPSHTYTVAGTYTVALTETGPDGANTKTRVNYVTVSDPPPPVAEFVGCPQTGVADLRVRFTSQSTGSITSHAWNFGDGTTTSFSSPNHTYTAPGTYTVSLTVTGPGGSDTRTRTAYIVVDAPLGLTELSLPSDALPLCNPNCTNPSSALTQAEFNSWFALGTAAPNGVVKPANSVTFRDCPNCDFYKWSEQMFLWLTSPAPPSYGSAGGLIMNTPAFYRVSPPDPITFERQFVPNASGTAQSSGGEVVAFSVATQGGHLGLPIVRERGTRRMLEVIPPVLSRSGRQLVMDGAGNEVEVGDIRFTDGDRPVLLDIGGNEIPSPRAVLRKASDSKARAFEKKLENLERSGALDRSGLVQKLVFRQKTVVLDPFGNFLNIEQGQAPDNAVLMAQSGSLVYYSISVNNVFAFYRTMWGATVPGNAKFPTKQSDPSTDPDVIDLDEILDWAALNGHPSVIDSEALAVEIKTSWVEADSLLDPSKFIQMTAVIPTYDQCDPLEWVPNGKRVARLALVGMHIAGSLGSMNPQNSQGHPEMAWASFEHVSNAPAAEYMYRIPPPTQGGTEETVLQDTSGNWLFCANGASDPFNVKHMELGSLGKIVGVVDGSSTFPISPSNVRRDFPWGNLGDKSVRNSEVIGMNNVVRGFLPGDVRSNYIHIGTTWTSDGEGPRPDDPPFNPTNQKGATMMANSTIETFVQDEPFSMIPENPGMNCFDCHMTNTTEVSHVFNSTAPLF